MHLSLPRPGARRAAVAGLATAAAAAAALVAPTSASAAPTASPADVEYVGVSVATVWTAPDSPRPVDAKAVANPVDIPGWLADMSDDQQAALTSDNLTQTQALYGTAVHVLDHSAGWTEVAVTGQPSPKNSLGYPGWVPDDQLVSDPAYGSAQSRRPFALLDHKLTSWLYDDRTMTHKALQLSVNTRLPVTGRAPGALRVSTPGAGSKWISDTAATVYRSNRSIPKPTGADLVRTARMFLDQPYLWGGRSAFGVDCSGFTGTIYELNGITIPRDSGPQAVRGGARTVARDELRPGDLIFYSHGGDTEIYHVAMYVGGGDMIEAYDHTTPVRITPVRFIDTYWGAVRYLNG